MATIADPTKQPDPNALFDFAAQQSLERPLGELLRRPAVAVAPETPLAEALATMHQRGVGSVLVSDANALALGILTRHDILERVALARVALDTPIAKVMTSPLHTLDVACTAQDAALLMARHAIHHVPVTRDGRLAGLVSERDLFAMQRLSLKHVSATLRAARDVDALADAASDIRSFARHLIGQGVAARQLTQLISRLNDLLTERLVQLLAQQQGIDLGRVCWLAFGSEGRSEQTISTDQDNGLIFVSDTPEQDRARWTAFARQVNQALQRCGFPLCNGDVMASNPQCCLTADEWKARFAHWIERGTPDDLLKARIFFDLRPLVGRTELATPLRERITNQAALPRFVKQLADNALRNRVPLNWRGAIETLSVKGHAMVDLKRGGSAIFVDAARLYALAHSVSAPGTRERLELIGPLLNVPTHESRAWIAAFEYLQMLRLQTQIANTTVESANLIEPASLNDIDRRMLKESLRVARRLMQKVELDYRR